METAAKRASLLESAAELRALFEAALDAIVITDDEGRLVDANAAAVELFAVARPELLGRGLEELAEAEDEFAGCWSDFLRAGWARMEFRVVRPGGEARTVECSSRAAFVPGRHFFFLRDVTERRQLEEQVRHAQKMEAIGRLVGGIAHDFNNLLTAVMIYSGLLAGEVSKHPRLRAYADEIQSAGARGAVLVNQLLALGRRQVLEPRLISLGQALSDMRDFLQRTLGEDIELQIERTTAGDTVRVDPTQLHQVVLNLALNARDAMPKGGRLTLAVEAWQVPPDVRQQELAPGPYLRLQVRDTGCGMTPEVRARIFEPFFTTKARGKGSGLGLPMVYSIVQQSGGAVEVESAPGAGTTISLFLPALAEEPEQPARERSGARVGAVRATVLLVEDEELVRKSLGSALAAAGHRVLSAASAVEAIELARGHEFDVVVSDIVMPGINGRELAATLRQAHPSVRVILISGYADEPHWRRETGWEFLRKPFPPQRLVEKVDALLPRHT